MDVTDKLKALIEAWAVTEGLQVGKIDVSIVQPILTASVSLFPPKKKKKLKFHPSNRPLETNDWEAIMKLPWNSKQRSIMETVRKDPQRAIPKELCSKTKHGDEWPLRLNFVFLCNKANYRFSTWTGELYLGGHFRLWAGEQR